MNVIGIIAEYNPFHNGHLYHLQEAKRRGKADFVVAVMSGDFVQRGEPAILNKWVRAQLAVDCGVNLVLELPYVFACNSAEFFAKGAVGILSGLGCVTHLAFGSETGDIHCLEKIASVSAEESGPFQIMLKERLKTGISYGKAREETISSVLGGRYGQAVKNPNDILAVEYLKQLLLQESKMKPLPIQRHGPGYYDLSPKNNIASATAIRNHIPNEERSNYVPEAVNEMLGQTKPRDGGLFSIIRAEILRVDACRLKEIYSVGEGLECKLKKEIRRSSSLEELIENVKSKRYPENRIRRMLCHILLGLKSDFFGEKIDLYGRVLAFDEKGAKLLKLIKREERAVFPVLTNMTKEAPKYPQLEKTLRYDVLASDLYHIFSGQNLYEWSDHVCKPYGKIAKTLEVHKK